MKKLMALLLFAFLLQDCRNKKTKLADEDTVAINEFIEFFEDIKLPFEINDKVLSRKETDSATIGYKIFTQFVPDSILIKQFGKTVKPKIYPLGKVAIKKFETYLFLKAVTPARKAGFILAFDADDEFIAGMPLVVIDKDATTLQSGVMDTKYTVTETVRRKNADGQIKEAKNVYILNSEAHAFSLIMADEGLELEKQEIINPIDTFPRKNKYAGDYRKDKRNIVSIRDGKNPSSLMFFVHFEKNNGECRGELKGEAQMHGTKTAIYRANGNPCVLEFTFSGNAVTMNEEEACGSYRDIICFFEGTYAKRKETVQNASRKTKK